MNDLRAANADRLAAFQPEELGRTIGQWLERQMPDARVHMPEPVRASAGASSEIYFLEPTIERDHARDVVGMVLRAEPGPDGIYKAPSVAREFAILRALGNHNVAPVPEALWLEEDAAILGAPFMVMARVEGAIPGGMHHSVGLLADSTPEDRSKIWRSAIETMAGLHSANPDDFAFLGSAADGLSAEITKWCDYAEWSGVVPSDEQERAKQWLLANRPDDGSGGFAWGDARPENMIFQGTQCVAVIDWETASLGGAETDLGWWLFFDWLITEGFGLPRLEGVPDAAETLAIWEGASGRKVRNMAWHELFATWRFSLISERSQMLSGSGASAPVLKPWNRRLTQLLDDLSAQGLSLAPERD